ncbi:Septin-10 [Daphnia sinensis]|uniref:Septin-10 n=1 Tax=Daphnia sinensis TaxID=1820382 RepID=A0AAD5KTP8_9CRUS|nr:Septin-10 [Daphnia sinensis]
MKNLKSLLVGSIAAASVFATVFWVNADSIGGTELGDDFDGDGIINSIDLDDDNDGVLDIVESPVVLQQSQKSQDLPISQLNLSSEGDCIAGLCRYSAVSDISINVPSTHNPIYSNKFVCLVDLDGDGKSNHHDLDSDGDGCSDALEGGATTDESADFKFTSAVGTNGVVNALETAVDSGVLNFTSTYFPYGMSRNIAACADTDGDGIKDTVDIDDDNDGILDGIESPNCFFSATEWNTSDKSFLQK